MYTGDDDIAIATLQDHLPKKHDILLSIGIGSAMYINPSEWLKYLSQSRLFTSRKFKANQAKPKLI